MSRHEFTFNVGDVVQYDWDNVGDRIVKGDKATVVSVPQEHPHRIILVRWLNPRPLASRQSNLFEYKFKPSGGPW